MNQLQFQQLKDDQLESWFDFVASVFTAGRQYFVNHWINDFDYSRNTRGIFICTDSGKIVGSVRVFKRSVFINGDAFSCGGIGEVSTAESHRNKGIASTLLKMAITYMNQEGMKLSSLHTGNPSAMRLYHSLGWVAKKRSYIKRELKSFISSLSPSISHFGLEKTDFDKYASELDKLQFDFEKASNWNGPVQRNPAYWISWVKRESPYSCVLKDGEKIIGYISLGPKKREETTLSVKDFLCTPSVENLEEHTWNIFSTILTKAIPLLESENRDWMDKVTHIIFTKVIVPNGKLTDLQDGECTDEGFMYKDISSSQQLMDALSNCNKHVYWDVDNF